MPPTLTVLTRHRDFRRLFLAQLAVFGGDWFVLVPLLVLLHDMTGSGAWGALALAADTGIHALLLPFTGTIADRFDRRKIMMVANLAAVVAVSLLFAVRSRDTAWVGIVAISGMAVAKAFYSPAASAALPNLVPREDLATANTIAGSAWGTMAVVGASVGGVLSAAFSPYVAFAGTAVALVAAATLVWRVRTPMQSDRNRVAARTLSVGGVGPAELERSPEPAVRRPAYGTWSAIGEGLRYIGHRPRVLALVTVKSAAALGNGALVTYPLLAASFAIGPTGTGLLFAVRGLGALIGPLLMRRVLTHRDWLLPGLAISMATFGIAYLGVSQARWFPLVLGLVFIAHVAGGSNWTISNYALQAEVPDELRGRVFSTDMMLATMSISTSQLIIGALVDSLDMRVLIAACGGITLAYAVAWRLATSRLRPRSLTEPGARPAGEPEGSTRT